MNVPFITDDALRLPHIRHGFFGRRGGISDTQYNSLNCGAGSGDSHFNVRENRQRVAHVMNIEPENLISLSQIHSRDVVFLTDVPKASIKADGMVTTLPGLALGVLSADCGPVLLADLHKGIIGACHAGWKGATSGVVQETVSMMRSLGANKIVGVLGPHIHMRNYEVGHAFRDERLRENPSLEAFFEEGPKQTPHFNLTRCVSAALIEADVKVISSIDRCTYAQPEDYFSYRYNTHHDLGDYGRNISAIMLKA